MIVKSQLYREVNNRGTDLIEIINSEDWVMNRSYRALKISKE